MELPLIPLVVLVLCVLGLWGLMRSTKRGDSSTAERPEAEADRVPLVVRREEAAAARADPVEPREGAPPSKSDTYLSEEESTFYLVRDSSGRLPVHVAGGWFQHPETGKRVGPGNRALQRAGVWSYTVRGTAYYPEDGIAGNTSPGARVRFRREPENSHDPNAVAVLALDADGEARRVGYVNKGYARTLSKRLAAGETINARFIRGSLAGVQHDGIAVVETSSEDMRRLFRR
ncbi:HIRAN domain-containing protein [Brachybacterium sp. AOP43-C2-M15]|uniref:HIRAN domain-containing protein n=1 Tax=Brachybacterium sp. AOP43-C2-M15 TaxID=3457661 RepID=UPI0040338079